MKIVLTYTHYVIDKFSMSEIKLEHAGIVLKEEFMDPYGVSMTAVARAIGVPANRIHGIIHGVRNITVDTDLRLTKYFGLSEGYFLRLQESFNILEAKRVIKKDLQKIIPIFCQVG